MVKSMVKACAQCGKEFLAQRSSAKFCSTSCRVRSHEGVPAAVGLSAAAAPAADGELVLSVIARVELAGMSGSPDGLAAVVLARAFEANVSSSNGAALYRQFTVAMDRIEVRVPKQGGMDELRLRRDRKQRSA